MYNLEGNKLVVGGRASGDEEEGGVAAVHNLGVYIEMLASCSVMIVSLKKTQPALPWHGDSGMEGWWGEQIDLYIRENCTCVCAAPTRAERRP